MSTAMSLIDAHLADLRRSALSDEFIETMNCRSVLGAEISKILPTLSVCESLLAIPYLTNNGFERYKLFPQLGDMKYYQPTGSTNHIYMLPTLDEKLFDTSTTLYIIEGEKKCASLVQRGYVAVGIAGLWCWKETADWQGIDEIRVIPFLDRETVIIPDSDIWVQKRVDLQKAVYTLGKYLEACGAKLSVLVLPQGVDKLGADDYFAAGHCVEEFDQLRRLRLKDPPLGQHKQWYIDWKELKSALPKGDGKMPPSFMTDVEPCTELVPGAELLDSIVDLICQYVIVPTELAHSVALWILHAWALDSFDISPLLFITSATKRCGKTLLLEIVGTLSPRPLIASNITGPTLFRVVDQYHPTMLVDEADTFIKEDDGLRGIINAGHRRATASVARTVGDSHEIKIFSTWSPKAIAAIDRIADTQEDRSVLLPWIT
jgi:hypothetical protein